MFVKRLVYFTFLNLINVNKLEKIKINNKCLCVFLFLLTIYKKDEGKIGMFDVEWDLESNGILLVNSSNNKMNPPRPVFYEELDLLGFNKFWKYPRTEAPLLWNSNRKYFYKGKFVAEAKGGSMFEKPTIILQEEGQKLSLEPVNVPLMVEKNLKAITVLENESIDFIESTFKKYKKRVNQVVVSYSGGKDSQVILDLATRTLSPDDFVVIFTDTTMEIPPTYATYDKIKEYYGSLYPNLKFYVARNEKHSLDLWRIFGPPSRIHRWCCSVYKTSPQVRLIKSLNQNEKNIKILVFDGVRADESPRRSAYERITNNAKHFTQINGEVIRHWNTSEVFLYLFKSDLRDKNGNFIINEGYRYGLERVGCSICPFSSPWSEFIIKKSFPKTADSYLEIIKEHTQNLGLEDKKEIKKYIEDGGWKKRGGGEGVERYGVHVNILRNENNFKTILSNPRENLFSWMNVLNFADFKEENENKYFKLYLGDKVYNCVVSILPNGKLSFSSKIGESDKDFLNKIEKVLYKTAYCIHCGACEAECPTSALKVFPKVQINQNKCTHCYNCLDFIEKGCLLAKSVNDMEGNMNKPNLKGFGRYLTFGMRNEWLKQFLNEPDFWSEKNTLGPKQFESMNAWLKDSELMDLTKKPTALAYTLSKLIEKDEIFVNQIIWINLFHNSSVVKWYLENLKWGSHSSSKELLKKLTEDGQLNQKTASSGLNSLLNMLENMPAYNTLKLGMIEKVKRERYIRKIGTNDIHPIAVLYSLYRYAIAKKKYKLTVSELYRDDNKDGGPYLIFGIERSALENILRWLEENKSELIRVNLTANLDNINLSEDIKDYKKILEYY